MTRLVKRRILRASILDGRCVMMALSLLLRLAFLMSSLSACGRWEFLTSDPVEPALPAETFQDCVRRLRPEFERLFPDQRTQEERLRATCGPAVCEGICSACIDDTDCGPARLCIAGACGACPVVSDCTVPESGLELLTRNGCEVCQVAPPTECRSDADCAVGTCRRGAICAKGCDRLDCCANVCSSGDCAEPVPYGCLAECIDPPAFLPECRTVSCSCVNNRWRCAVVTTDVVLGSCVYRPL